MKVKLKNFPELHFNLQISKLFKVSIYHLWVNAPPSGRFSIFPVKSLSVPLFWQFNPCLLQKLLLVIRSGRKFREEDAEKKSHSAKSFSIEKFRPTVYCAFSTVNRIWRMHIGRAECSTNYTRMYNVNIFRVYKKKRITAHPSNIKPKFNLISRPCVAKLQLSLCRWLFEHMKDLELLQMRSRTHTYISLTLSFAGRKSSAN